MIDPELVTRKATLITKDLRALADLARMSKSEFVAGQTQEVLAERYLERAIGRMIDVNYHLVTEAGEPPPSDYFQSFTDLARIGALPAEFGREIAACAGLRNRLVHQYDEIDPSRIYDSVLVAVRDIPEYLRHVDEYVRTRAPAVDGR